MGTQSGASPTSLGDLISGLSDADETLTVYVASGAVVSQDMSAMLVNEEIEDPPEEMRYFLEISVAQEVLDVWSAWRAGRTPSTAEACAALDYYATNDAFEPV